MSGVVAAVDIGGTKTAVAAVDREGNVSGRVSVPTPADRGAAGVLDTVAGLVRATEPLAVGVGCAGAVDGVRGVVRSATDAITGWAGTDVRGDLTARLGVPVAVDNDVHMHAEGERWTGAATGHDQAVVVTVGTGVGASWIADGAVRRGAHGVAGHLGHLPCPAAVGRRCPCGARGHLEAVASGPALLAAYNAQTRSQLRGVPEVVEAATGGDEAATAVLAEAGAAVGAVLGGVVNLLDPDVVVIGGGVSRSGAAWWDPLRSALAAQLLPATADVDVVPAALGDDAALVGAARLAWALV